MVRVAWGPLIGIAYVVSLASVGKLHGGNVFLGALGFLDIYNAKTRLFLRTFLPCIVTGAIYDSFRFIAHPLIAGHVHIAGPYVAEHTLFSFRGETLNELFARHHWAIADLATGAAYLVYVAEYLGFAILMFVRQQPVRARTFARGFLVVNLLGFTTWFVYPAAPPWYVTAHGFGPARFDIVPSPAGALRFDALLGTHLFQKMYAHSAELYGALPSLHVAYPVVAALLVWQMPTLRWARWPALGYAMLMAFAAVYLQHHYLIDVLLGMIYATLTVTIVRAWERPRRVMAYLS